MRTYISKIMTVTLATVLLLFTACKKDEATVSPTTGDISVKFEVKFTNGTTLPLTELSNWNINVELYSGSTSNPIKTQVAKSSSGVNFSGLTPGSYDVECDGVVTYRGQVLTASGSSGVQVQAGKSATTTVNLQ